MDGSISVPVLSKKLGINASVLYSRIKRLMKKKLIKKFTVEIDESLLGIGVKASVGINRDPKLKEVIHKKFMETSEVVSISEVTGRFDIMIEVYAKNLEALHSVVIEKIAKSIIGTCVALGVKVEGKTPKEITAEINEGKWDQKFQ